MSVAVAITVTLPATTAAAIVATGTDFSTTIGKEVIRLVQNVVADEVKYEKQGVPSVSTTVT